MTFTPDVLQYGAFGLALVMVWYILRLIDRTLNDLKETNQEMREIIKQGTEAQVNTTAVLQRICMQSDDTTAVLRDLCKKIDELPKQQ